MSMERAHHDDDIAVKLPLHGDKNKYQVVIGKHSDIKADVEEFRGIPYGIVPARWHHAKLREKLPSDKFDATSNGPRCCQPSEGNSTDGWQSHLDFPSDVTESEFDCLNLLIARPSRQTLVKAGLERQIDRLPVYVYIHGGGYAYGAATDPMWNPARLVSRSVELKKPFIAVNINYRLNIFGFAASSDIIQTQDETTKGCNFALRDQRIALEWVSRNIVAFGGDPERITVGGQSAGATSAHAHVLDAKYSSSKPLITRGIIQSAAVGTLGPVPLTEAEERWAYLCKNFGAASLPAAERFAKMASVSTQDLLKAVKLAGWWTFPVVQDDLTLSRIEGGDWKFSLKLNNDDAVASEGMGSPCTIDVLIGDTDVEGSVYQDMIVTRIKTPAQVNSAIVSSRASPSAINDIKQCYRLDADVPLATVHSCIYSFLTDMKFGLSVDRAWYKMSTAYSQSMDQHTKVQTKPVQYRVQFGNPFDGPNYNVAQHCVDLIYIYDCFHDDLRATDARGVTQEGMDRAANGTLVEQLQSDWIHFITATDIEMSEGPSEDELIIYGRDRRRTVVSKHENQEYQDRQARFAMLEKHWADANKIFGALRLI